MIFQNCFLVDQRHYAIENVSLAELATYNRINALTTIYRAQRGWIGASLSCTELLTSLYFDVADIGPDPLSRDRIVLGKGHAAAMQYACLAGRGIIPVDDLLRYKHPGAPQAHTDIATPGIDVNTGSLGQALSKCCGLAMAGDKDVYAILGDGELQEGQNFEAFMTVCRYRPANLTIIIDLNGLQSDSQVSDIMAIPDLPAVLKGMGLDVVEVDGQAINSVRQILADSRGVPARIVIAKTMKGAGISFMAADTAERRSYGWHGGVPNATQYRAALAELAERVSQAGLKAELEGFLQTEIPTAAAKPKTTSVSTGVAFGQSLVNLAENGADLYVFDADLEKSCRLTEFATTYPERFIEMGIAEQDMVSCAGGFALQGRLPVVNTYAAFYRRAYEQVYVNAGEHTRVIYAGHYAGLCYAFDGKTHQCTGDIAMMRAIPGMTVLYPTFPQEIPQMLEWYTASGINGPLYIRLHRTPSLADLPLPTGITFRLGHGVQLCDNDSETAILTSGPHMSAFCLEAAGRCGVDVYCVSTLRPLSEEFVRGLIGRYTQFCVVEEIFEAGGLFDEFSHVVAGLETSSRPIIRHHAVDDFTHSTLQADGLYEEFGLVPDGIFAAIKGDRA